MIRSRKTAAAVVGLAAAAFGVSAGAAGAATPPEDRRGAELEAAIGAYQTVFPRISAEAAEAAATGQEDRKEIYRLLAEKDGGQTFGGAWFDPPTGVLHIASTSGESAEGAAKLGGELGLKVEPTIVKRSFLELERQAGELRKRADELGKVAQSQSGIDVKRNQVVVAVSSAQRASLAESARLADVALVDLESQRIEADAGCTSRAACDWTVRAGSMLWRGSAGNNVCSVGFTARNSSNQRYTYTAGHCSSGAGVTWGTGGISIGAMGSSVNSGPLDAAIISVTNSWFKYDLGGEIYRESSPGRSAKVNYVAPTLSYIWSGETVCLAANITQPNGPNFCGVVGTNSDPSVRGMVRVDGLDACPGDSGGGWYWLASSSYRVAYGLHSRSNTGCHGSQGGSRSWFSAVPSVKAGFTPSLNVETR